MRILDFFTRLIHRADRFEAMVGKLGVAEELGGLADHAGVVDRAVERCLKCESTQSCQQWLNQNETAEQAPDYCPNHDLFERLLKASWSAPVANPTKPAA